MAKRAATVEFNMSETIRDILRANSTASPQEVSDAILAKYPGAEFNKNSFTVAYYTSRKKLGIGSTTRKSKFMNPKTKSLVTSTVDLAKLQATARFLNEVGGIDAALEAIRQVQAIQVN